MYEFVSFEPIFSLFIKIKIWVCGVMKIRHYRFYQFEIVRELFSGAQQ